MWLKGACICLALLTNPALAQNDFKGNFKSSVKGLAMVGEPHLSDSFEHLPYADPNAPRGGDIVIQTQGSFNTVNPLSLKGQRAQGFYFAFDRLMARSFDEPFTLYPLIAESYEMPQDRSAITFTLNKNAKFQDGSPIRAEDIEFTWALLKEKGRPNQRSVYNLVDKVTIKDNYTIRFDFKKGYTRETAMILAMMMPLSQKYWQERQFEETTFDPPVSSGPYKIAKVDPGREIIYQRNPDYWAADLPVNKGLYNFDRITYRYYRDNTVAQEAFLKGDADIRREYDLSRWRSGYPDNETYIRGEFQHGRAQNVRGIIMNTRVAPFDNPNIRKAMTLAFDGEQMNKLLFGGQKSRIHSYFPNTSFSQPVSQEKENFRQALRKAQDLLKGSTDLNPTILVSNALDERIALFYAQSLKKIGVGVKVQRLDSAAFNDRLANYNFDMIVHFWRSTLSPGAEQAQFWGCEAAKTPYKFNYAGICDPAIEALLPQFAEAKTRYALTELAKELDKMLLENAYMVPLFYNPKDFIAHNAELRYPQYQALYGPIIETWWVQQNGK